MSLAHENAWTVRYPLDSSKGTFEGGVYDLHLVLDEGLLPKVCVHCAGEGTIKEKFFFMEDLPGSFWKASGAAFGIPVLFAFGALLTAKFGGSEALSAYGALGGAVVALSCAGAGFIAARAASGRSRYALIFYLCSTCEWTYRRLSKRVLTLSWAAVGLFGGVLLSPLLWIGAPERQGSASAVVILLLAALLMSLAAIIKFHLHARRFRGLSAHWRHGDPNVRVTFANMAVGALASGQRKSR